LAKLIVCITGMPGSGKSTIVSALKAKGLEALNLGDGVRAEAKKRNRTNWRQLRQVDVRIT